MMLDPSVGEPLVAAIPKMRTFAISLCRGHRRWRRRGSSLCGCPVGTVKSRVNRARSELARLLSIVGPEDFKADAVFSAAIGSGGRVPTQAYS